METRTTAEFKEADLKSALGWLKAGENGLSEEEAAGRAKEFGLNEVLEKKKSIVIEFFSHFWSPIPWFLEIAAILTFFIGDWKDAVILASLLVINVVIGFYNEHDSQKALELLKHKLTIKTKVLRAGKWETKEARQLVPGDIIIIGLGDVVPADAKIIRGEICADQSALTGESLPVELRESGVLFTGSIIKRGEAKCLVVNTGMRTYFGKTVELVNIAKAKSKQEEIMFRISRNIIYAGMAAFFVILCYSFFIQAKPVTILTFAVLFIAGGVPAALPVMFTIAQSKGATDLSKKGVLVTKLESIENAASMEILCLDKTGTITMNELQISEAIPLSGTGREELLALAALASSAESKDTIDNTVIAYAKKNGASLAAYSQLSYTPFEPSTKRAEGIVETNGKKFKVVKGAPQMVISICTWLTKEQKDEASAKIELLSSKGCRVLAVAKSAFGDYRKLSLAGLLALSDPLRPDSMETIAALRAAGIQPIMLTGDNISVAREMAKQAGIGGNIVRISEIKALPESGQADAVEKCDGIAEIYPEDKYWVVKLLQSKGRTVGMTGDGVNDAPALKQAELGIAVSSSTDVAKAAASMVLMEPGTKVILEGVRISRETYQRMLTWTLKKIVFAIQFMVVLSVGFFWLQDVIISILGLMLLVIVSDFITMSLAVDNSRSTKNPNSWNVKNITIASAFMGLFLCIISIALLAIGIDYLKFNLEQIRTLTILVLVFTGQFTILVVRERGHFWASRPARLVSGTIGFSIIAFVLIAIFGTAMTPLAPTVVLAVLAACALYTFAMDWPKAWLFKRLGIS